jgi:hypothetical protein
VFFLGLLILVLSNNSYFHPSNYNYIAVYTADDSCSTTTWGQEYLPKWTHACLPKPNKKTVPLVITASSGSKVSSISENDYGRTISFTLTNQTTSQIIIRRYYFPGWNVFIDGKSFDIVQPYGKEGLIAVTVPSGAHSVKVLWQGTLIEKVSNWISFVSVFTVIIFLLSFRKLKKLL